MQKRNLCTGHTNGFTHLDDALEGMEDEYDVGIKFKEEESDLYSVDAITGKKIWAERLLVLYASVAHEKSPDCRRTLRYGLTRAAYERATSIEQAYPMLKKLALPVLASDLKSMKAGKEPASATKITMLHWAVSL